MGINICLTVNEINFVHRNALFANMFESQRMSIVLLRAIFGNTFFLLSGPQLANLFSKINMFFLCKVVLNLISVANTNVL